MTEHRSLDEIIRSVLDVSDVADPAELADEVMSKIPEREYVHYLRLAIRARLGDVARIQRNAATPAIAVDVAPQTRRVGVSTKQALIRDEYWPRFLQQRIFLPTGYKFLAKATADDLRTAAQQRAVQARELLFRADQFTTLAELMDQQSVRFLEELDSTIGVRILERVA